MRQVGTGIERSRHKGEGEAYFLLIVIGIALLISAGYFAVGFISDVKDKRANYGKKPEAEVTPPVSPEEMGSYEIHF